MGQEIDRIMQNYGITSPVAPVYASNGGHIKHLADKYGVMRYAEGGMADPEPGGGADYPVAPAASSESTAGYVSTPQIKDLQDKYRKMNSDYDIELRQSLSSPAMSKVDDSEKYLRLASAFLAPTRTGAFTENLGLAGSQMAEINKGDREAALSSLKLRLAAQKQRMEFAKEDINSTIRAAQPIIPPTQQASLKIREQELALKKEAQGLKHRQEERAYRNQELESRHGTLQPGYRYRDDGIGVEPVPGGSADLKAKANAKSMDEARKTINLMKEQYDILLRRRAIKGAQELSAFDNTLIGLRASPQGMAFADLVTLDPEEATNHNIRKRILAFRQQLRTQAFALFGITSRESDTKAELENLLETLGNPANDYESVMAVLKNMEKRIATAPAATAAPAAESPVSENEDLKKALDRYPPKKPK